MALAASARSRRARAQPVGERAVLDEPTAPLAAAPAVLLAPELEQRPELTRDERRLVRPVLQHAPAAARGEPVEDALVVVADAAEHGQVVAALEHVDRVDLQQPETVDHPGDLRVPGASGSGRPKPCAARRCVGRVRGLTESTMVLRP
jgi:hypothetical protein